MAQKSPSTKTVEPGQLRGPSRVCVVTQTEISHQSDHTPSRQKAHTTGGRMQETADEQKNTESMRPLVLAIKYHKNSRGLEGAAPLPVRSIGCPSIVHAARAFHSRPFIHSSFPSPWCLSLLSDGAFFLPNEPLLAGSTGHLPPVPITPAAAIILRNTVQELGRIRARQSETEAIALHLNPIPYTLTLNPIP